MPSNTGNKKKKTDNTDKTEARKKRAEEAIERNKKYFGSSMPSDNILGAAGAA